VGEYLIEASVSVNRPREEVMRWLTEPDLMARWIVGADRAESVGDHAAAAGSVIRLSVSMAGGQFRVAQTYLGEVIEVSEFRLVRRYRLEHVRAGVAQMVSGPAEYERTVTYSLSGAGGGMQVNCAARTVIPGLAQAAAKAGARAESRSLRRSLDRLRECAEDGQRGLLGRLRDGSQSAQAL
jgi:uncharacterized protein YndB with AHSA1/START domain